MQYLNKPDSDSLCLFCNPPGVDAQTAARIIGIPTIQLHNSSVEYQGQALKPIVAVPQKEFPVQPVALFGDMLLLYI